MPCPILASVTNNPDLPVFAVVLAAGCASRFGATKQLSEFDGAPLARLAINLAHDVCVNHSMLVVGHDWLAVSAACQPLPGFLILNDHFAEGIGASISRAVRSLRHAASAIIVLLADQPLITREHVRGLLDAWSGADNAIVATAFAGTVGPPALFAHGCFADLWQFTGDQGARELLFDDRFSVTTVDFDDAAFDIDTPQDLDRLRSRT